MSVCCSNCYHFTYDICVRRSVLFSNVYEDACQGSGTQGDRNFPHVGYPAVLDLCVQVQTKIMINMEFVYLLLALKASFLPASSSNAVTSKADITLQIQYLPVSGHLQHVLRRAYKCLLHGQCMRFGVGVCGRGCSLQCCSK